MMGEIAQFRPGNNGFSLAPQSLNEAMEYAKVIANSDIVPPDFRGKPGNVLIAVQMGMELGLPPMQAIQNISVVNGRPAVWGDSLMAIARAHPACEYISETLDERAMIATCKAKRKGQPEEVRTFSQQDAERAGLWGRNTWKQYPKRMLQMRARGFAIRDVFPDALRGIALAEEVQDIPERDMGPVVRIEEKKSGADPLPEYPQDRFDEKLPAWREAFKAGKTTPDSMIAKIESNYTLTDAQKKTIKGDKE